MFIYELHLRGFKPRGLVSEFKLKSKLKPNSMQHCSTTSPILWRLRAPAMPAAWAGCACFLPAYLRGGCI